MNILLTNDDGYQARGIRELFDSLSVEHNVYMCAPIRQMSASSHSITLFKSMELLEVSPVIKAVDGSPADCIKVALMHLYKELKFDLVLSGINDGPNMGEDIFYSGTVAGAREGVLNGIFSIATSLDGFGGERHFSFPAQFITEFIQKLTPEILKEKILLNINFPNIPVIKGMQVTHLGERIYKDLIILEEKDNKKYVRITGDDPGFTDSKGSDMNAVHDGIISVTPLANEVYDKNILKKLFYLESEIWKSFR